LLAIPELQPLAPNIVSSTETQRVAFTPRRLLNLAVVAPLRRSLSARRGPPHLLSLLPSRNGSSRRKPTSCLDRPCRWRRCSTKSGEKCWLCSRALHRELEPRAPWMGDRHHLSLRLARRCGACLILVTKLRLQLLTVPRQALELKLALYL
jgi:hypothetical protein